ncbi:hypothetical protein COOONC_01537 [Cooperia oncophora]
MERIQEVYLLSETDRLGVTTGVFIAKLMELCSDLFKKHVLGEHRHDNVVEWYTTFLKLDNIVMPALRQKRGRKVQTPERSGAAMSTKRLKETEHYNATTSDTPSVWRCGPSLTAYANWSCDKRFLKPLRHTVLMEGDGYPLYKRRNLLTEEIRRMISAEKYLYMYILKGPDRADINIERAYEAENKTTPQY